MTSSVVYELGRRGPHQFEVYANGPFAVCLRALGVPSGWASPEELAVMRVDGDVRTDVTPSDWLGWEESLSDAELSSHVQSEMAEAVEAHDWDVPIELMSLVRDIASFVRRA